MEALVTALSKVNDITLLKIHDKMTTSPEKIAQGTWDGCIYNQITGCRSVYKAADALGDSSGHVSDLIAAWDNLTVRNPNKVLFECVCNELSKRGYLTPLLKPQVTSNERVTVLFSSTIIPTEEVREVLCELTS